MVALNPEFMIGWATPIFGNEVNGFGTVTGLAHHLEVFTTLEQ